MREYVGLIASGGPHLPYRSAPSLMVRARQHFVIYDLVPEGIAVLNIQHRMRDIETLIAELAPVFNAEVEKPKWQP